MTEAYQPPHILTALEHLDDEPAAADVIEEEPPARRQVGMLVEVVVEGEPEPYRLTVTNRERIAYEMTAARHKEWPTPDNGRNFAMTFCTWSAAKRAGRTSATFQQWQDVLIEWDVIGDQPADPTR